jgi:hypothetical protein
LSAKRGDVKSVVQRLTGRPASPQGRSMSRPSARTRRLLAILVVALALSPGLLWRAAPQVDRGPQSLQVTLLSQLGAGTALAPGLAVAGVWHLSSKGEAFGGYSALVLVPRGKLVALSDRGWFLRLDEPIRPVATPVMGAVGAANASDKRLFDIEAATSDPVSGTMWLAYESTNSIRRYGPELTDSQEVRPAAMRDWPRNRGPEAMIRLADGRFVILSEDAELGAPPASQGLLFAGDPLDGAPPASFRFVPPPGFRPTDIAQLPDGRVVILLRKLELSLSLPLRLVASRLVIADPATIVAGHAWAWQPLAAIRDPLPPENYEGLAIEPRGDGVVRLWLISDDNGAVLQRTLLLALDWQVPEKHPGAPAARR